MHGPLESFTAEINKHFFLGEFSFGKNEFRSSSGQERELADHVIALPEALFVFQIKERDLSAPTDEQSVATWFRKKVLGIGSGQIADSLRFLGEQTNLEVENLRGHRHNLAIGGRSVIPILLYSAGSALPESVARYNHYVSKRAGFVHVLHVRDYYELCHTLVLPSELIQYFEFRRDLLFRNPRNNFGEPRIVAQFISETHEPLTDGETRHYLSQARADIASFDITPILRRFGEKVVYAPGCGTGLDYYRVLAAFSRLSRAEMRGFKKLLTWALEKAGGSIEIPCRLQSVNTGTGFLVFPVPDGRFESRLLALQTLAAAAKYESRFDHQIALSVARIGSEIELDWLFIDGPWQQDAEMEQQLAVHYPFRPMPELRTEYRYPNSWPNGSEFQ